MGFVSLAIVKFTPLEMPRPPLGRLLSQSRDRLRRLLQQGSPLSTASELTRVVIRAVPPKMRGISSY
jgi:hypothetical protein